MATIQIKRRTTSGSGPLTGSTGSVKAGEPLVDLKGGKLYIAKADKTASTASPLSTNDYISIPDVNAVNSQIDTKINDKGFGTAAYKNTGTGSGQIPILNSDGKLVDSVIPRVALTNTFVVNSEAEMLALSTAQEGDVAIRTDLSKTFILKGTDYKVKGNWQELLTPSDKVSSVNGKTGAVTITLTELGGAKKSDFDAHKQDTSLHFTPKLLERLNNVDNTYLSTESSASFIEDDRIRFNQKIIEDGLVLLNYYDDAYNPPRNAYAYGIDKTKVLTPTSIIDGGTY